MLIICLFINLILLVIYLLNRSVLFWLCLKKKKKKADGSLLMKWSAPTEPHNEFSNPEEGQAFLCFNLA